MRGHLCPQNIRPYNSSSIYSYKNKMLLLQFAKITYKYKEKQYQYDVIMSHGDIISRSTYFFCKGKQTNRSKTFFMDYLLNICIYDKIITKDSNKFKYLIFINVAKI